MEIPLLLSAPLLILAAYYDLRFLRIPDLISVALITIFVFSALFYTPDDLMTRLLAAAVVFGIGFLAFSLRLVGGGDVKLLSALMLFIPTNGIILFANLFSVSLLIGVASIIALRRKRCASCAGWKSLSKPKAFPMGISIALAGLTYPLVSGLT